MEDKFVELAKEYFRNNYSAYSLFGFKPVYDDFVEALESLKIDNYDYGICDDEGDIFRVKKINGVVSVNWR